MKFINCFKNKVTMKKLMFCALAVLGLVMTACEKSSTDDQVSNSQTQEVLLTFSPYSVTPMTRAATSIADICTHLDVWITDEDDNTIDLHQSSDDDGFGSVSVALDRTKTYNLVAVAHKCTTDATLDDGVISFPDDKVTHSMIYTAEFTPATTTSLSCEMQRIVGQFRLEITDVVPEEVTKFTYTIDGTHSEWNIEGFAANDFDRTGTINLTSRNNDGSATLNIFVMPSDLTTTDAITISVSALTSNDDVVETKTFTDVPLKASYKTTYHGEFFTTEQMSMSFSVDDLNAFDTINY